MFTFIGIVLAIAAMMGGYIMAHGKIEALIVPSEYVIIGGMGFGIMMANNGMATTMKSIKAAIGLLKPAPGKQQYIDLLRMMFQLFTIARKEGLLGLEQHVEKPEDSEIFKKNPAFLANHHACDFFCDTMKVILTGSVGPHDLSEMMELDLEVAHHEEQKIVEAWTKHRRRHARHRDRRGGSRGRHHDGQNGGEAAEIGKSVGKALVGTFLGILCGYAIFMPIAKSIETKNRGEAQYMNCIRYALFSFARGESPITCVEFARRNIEPTVRPGFAEMESAVKEKDAA